MKRYTYILMLLLLMMMMMMTFPERTFSQSLRTDRAVMLMGKWQVDSLDWRQLNVADQNRELVVKRIKEELPKFSYEFLPDGTLVHTSDKATIQCRWSLSPDGKMLVITNPTNNPPAAHFQILELTPSRLVTAKDTAAASTSTTTYFKRPSQ